MRIYIYIYTHIYIYMCILGLCAGVRLRRLCARSGRRGLRGHAAGGPLHRLLGLLQVLRLRLPLEAQPQGELHSVADTDALDLVLVQEDVRAELGVGLVAADEAEALVRVVRFDHADVDLVGLLDFGHVGILHASDGMNVLRARLAEPA